MQSTLRHYMPIGQVLMNRGRLTRTQLTTLLGRHRKSARLGELLVRARQITTEQLQTALAQQKQRRQPLGHTLMALGYVTEETMRRRCAPSCTSTSSTSTASGSIPPWRGWSARSTRCAGAWSRSSGRIDAGRGRGRPRRHEVVEELQQLLGLRVEIVTSTTAKIQRALKRLYVRGLA